MKIVVFGGTGFTGGNVVREAASRGHSVVAVSRSEPQQPVDGVRYETGVAQDLAAELIADADVVVAALSPRGDMAGRLVEVYGELAGRSAEAGARYLQVGGFSSLRPAPDAPRFTEGELADQFRQEALEGEATRVLLAEHAPPGLDWLFISPAGSYGAWAAGEPTGTYRVGERSLCSTRTARRPSPAPTSHSPSSTRSRPPAIRASRSASPTEAPADTRLARAVGRLGGSPREAVSGDTMPAWR